MKHKPLFRTHNKRLGSKPGILFLAAGLALAACAGGATPQPEGVIRVAMQPIVQRDPAFISSDSEVLVANHVYDYLVEIDASNRIQPRLARDWTVGDDGRVYVFSLAEDASFHDGSPLTAADVVWTFDRLRDPSLELPTVSIYSEIADIEATDTFEVTFTLSESNPFFLYDLSDNHALILKAGTENAGESFNGTGPFRVVNFIPEDRIELVANETYFLDGIPKLAGIDIIFFNDENAAVDALRGGQIDLVMRMSTSLFNSLEGEPGIRTIDIPTNGFDLVRLRSDRPPGDDPRVIRALKLATDRAEIFQLVQQGYGAVGRDSPIGPLNGEYYSEQAELPARDPSAAKALLADAGYPEGLSLELHTPDTGGRPDLAAVLQDQWAEAGIELKIVVEPESVYYGENKWMEENLGITGWGHRAVPQQYLDLMLVSSANWNESRFSDAEFDELAALAGSTMDEQARVRAYHEIQRILIERGPVIIPYYFAQFGAIREEYEGFELKAFAGRTDLSRVGWAAP